jgi:DNA-binding MarR family transcriptional regulator
MQDQFPLLDVFHETGNSAPQLVLCALRTAALLDRVVARALAPFNLHHAQFNALILLKREREVGLRPSVLGDYLCVSRPNVTKLLARLKSRGLIEERPDPVDGRAVLAVITPDGVRLADEAFASLTHDLTVAVNTLPVESGASLRALLDQFRNGLSQTLRASGCNAGTDPTAI